MISNFQSLKDEELECLARIHAHICGDGCLSCFKTGEKDRKNRAEICYFNSNIPLLDSFRQDMKTIFGVKMTYNSKQQKVTVKSIRIAKELLSLSDYGTYAWRVPAFVQKGNRKVKIEWIKAFSDDEGTTPKKRNTIRIKSMNKIGLTQITNLTCDLGVESWITGPNCDHSWYLNIRKEKEFCTTSKSLVDNDSGERTSFGFQ